MAKTKKKITHVRDWFKSTFSTDSNNCVETMFLPDAVLVRHSQDPRSWICYTYPEWRAFLDGVKAGEFDPVMV